MGFRLAQIFRPLLLASSASSLLTSLARVTCSSWAKKPLLGKSVPYCTLARVIFDEVQLWLLFPFLNVQGTQRCSKILRINFSDICLMILLYSQCQIWWTHLAAATFFWKYVSETLASKLCKILELWSILAWTLFLDSCSTVTNSLALACGVKLFGPGQPTSPEDPDTSRASMRTCLKVQSGVARGLTFQLARWARLQAWARQHRWSACRCLSSALSLMTSTLSRIHPHLLLCARARPCLALN